VGTGIGNNLSFWPLFCQVSGHFLLGLVGDHRDKNEWLVYSREADGV
jgi:hypothetical protein